MAQWLPSVSLTLLPHIGGIAGAFITKKQVKSWYDVSPSDQAIYMKNIFLFV